MTEQPLRRRDQALVVQLADGTLTGAAHSRAMARLRSIPDGERLIERQRRVARAVGCRGSPARAATGRLAGAATTGPTARHRGRVRRRARHAARAGDVRR